MRVDPESRWCLENQSIPVTDMCGEDVSIHFDYDFSRLTVEGEMTKPIYYSTFAYGVNNAGVVQLHRGKTSLFILPFFIENGEWQHIEQIGCPALEEKQIPYNICIDVVHRKDLPYGDDPKRYYQLEQADSVTALKITILDNAVGDTVNVFSNKLLTFKSTHGFLFLDSDIN